MLRTVKTAKHFVAHFFRPVDQSIRVPSSFFFSCAAELDHPCVVKLIEVFNSETQVFMAMEAVAGRELHEELMCHGRVDETRARNLFQQVGY